MDPPTAYAFPEAYGRIVVVKGPQTVLDGPGGSAASVRFVINQGNIVGQDLGRTPGFGVLSLNGGWRAGSGVQVTAGVDNVFDRSYAEHLSRSGAMVAGYEQTTRVNEPGRILWLKAGFEY